MNYVKIIGVLPEKESANISPVTGNKVKFKTLVVQNEHSRPGVIDMHGRSGVAVFDGQFPEYESIEQLIKDAGNEGVCMPGSVAYVPLKATTREINGRKVNQRSIHILVPDGWTKQQAISAISDDLEIAGDEATKQAEVVEAEEVTAEAKTLQTSDQVPAK